MSKAIRLIRPVISRISPPRNRMPRTAALPDATRTAVGVAKPRAHGQATIRTDTALSRASACGTLLDDQKIQVPAAIRMTSGTKIVATLSANDCIGALRFCASSTMCAMRAIKDSAATRSTLSFTEAARFNVPAETLSPGCRRTGIGSPVIVASSTSVSPVAIRQSTGMRSPGRTRMRSPGDRLALATERISSPTIRLAESGASCSSLSILEIERLRAEPSKRRPSRIRVIIIAAVSK